MNKEEVIKIMLDSLNADNRELAKKAGLKEEEVEAQIQQSQPSLIFMFGNMYDKLKDADALK